MEDAAAAPTRSSAELKLLVEARLGAAIIGRGGHVVRRIKVGSGVQHIHLSDNLPGVVDRTVTVTGTQDTLKQAYELITEVLRAEDGISACATGTVRLLVPDATSLVGEKVLGEVMRASGATIKASTPSLQSVSKGREVLLACTGAAEQTASAVLRLSDAVAKRHQARHQGFLSQWTFEVSLGWGGVGWEGCGAV